MMLIAGTVPVKDMPLTFGTAGMEGDSIVVEGRRVPCTQGTGAMVSAALATTNYLKLEPPYVLLAGDIGQGGGSREIYDYLIHNITKLKPEVIALHYWLPDMEQTRRLCQAIEKCDRKPVLIADAASMYSAKAAGLAPFFDVFTPDAVETAFLADPDATHPAYVRFMLFNDMERVAGLIGAAYEQQNAARLMLVKGAVDYIVSEGEIIATVNEPDVPMMEAIGGTGDTITGMVAAFIHAGLEPHEAATIAARANRMAGKMTGVTPATRVARVIEHLPVVFQKYLCKWSGVCTTGGVE
jgi:NAD(P)H-hydrate repair Nnr-like enzyme with NAD(P)H-hydrate dehydratase domain